VLKTLWRNEELWKNTVVFINYDENDGYFDHVVTPTPPATETDEYIGGQPIGYGNRVPLTVISPFSRGGWVNSQVADHTSILRFLETWTGVQAPNITKWRRKISSDLLSCFDFANPDYSIPTLPDAFNLRNQADRTQTQLPTAKAPAAGAQVAPIQEPGVLKARALPYQPTASLAVSGLVATLRMANAGTAAVNLQVNHRKIPLSGKWFDVDNTAEVAAAIPVSDAAYGISVHGPNGFLRTFAGAPTTGLTVKDSIREGGKPRLEFELTNTSTQPLHVVLTENRPGQGDKAHRTVAVGATIRHEWASHYFENNWYDVVVTVVEDSTFIHRFAGHLENGNPSFSG
jgi:phospholipase C